MSPRLGWALAAALLVGVAAQATRNFEQGDFGAYHRAAGRVLDGAAIYDSSEEVPFRYSPAAAILLAPLGALPLGAAKVLWAALNVALLLLWLGWSVRRFGGEAGEQRVPWLPLAALALALPPVRSVFALGQIEPLLLCLAAASLWLARERPNLSGALLALAIAFKPPFLLLALPGLVAHPWRRLGATAAGLALLAALPALRYGPSGALEQHQAWRAELAGGTASALCHSGNQSLWAMGCSLGLEPGSAGLIAATTAMAALLTAGMWALWRRAQRPARLLEAAALYGTALLSPIGWATNLVALLPLLVLLLAAARHQPRWRWALAIPAGAAGFALLAHDLLGPEPLRQFFLLRGPGLAGVATALAAAAAHRKGSPVG